LEAKLIAISFCKVNLFIGNVNKIKCILPVTNSFATDSDSHLNIYPIQLSFDEESLHVKPKCN
jgi:hypothetical protein